ncbi:MULTISPECIES: multicopper oxidase family protein [unclassified Nocardiopsis]|uniref:multicopper oxidase family protein n=1 Tax=Nocardiopsis TaxID=2013 RepID=UPI00387B7694
MTTETSRRSPLGRRAFLAAAGTAVAAAAAVPAVRALTGPDLPTDRPELPGLPELATTDTDGLRVAELVAASAGPGLVYNGSSPGPLLRLREGDRVRVDFTNTTDAPSSLHLHGLPLTPDVDRPLEHVMPGGSSSQEFTVTPGCAGTYWYHPHAHGDVERQLLAGLAGPVVVTGPADERPGLVEADDRLVMFTVSGREILANGVRRPGTTVRSGLTRLRLLNATAGDHLLLGCVRRDRSRPPLHLIATDAGLIERPHRVQEILLAPGERAEVLVETTEAGPLGLVRLPYSVHGPGGEAANDEETLLVLDVPEGLAPVPLPDHLAPVEELDPATAVRTRRVVFDAAPDGAFTVDGRVFDMDRVDARADLDTLEIWEVANDHAADHPFHLHSYPVQVLDRDGVPEPFRAWRDTVNVPAGSTVRLLVPFRHGGGRTVYHCHILNHEDLGMMGVLEVAG